MIFLANDNTLWMKPSIEDRNCQLASTRHTKWLHLNTYAGFTVHVSVVQLNKDIIFWRTRNRASGRSHRRRNSSCHWTVGRSKRIRRKSTSSHCSLRRKWSYKREYIQSGQTAFDLNEWTYKEIQWECPTEAGRAYAKACAYGPEIGARTNRACHALIWTNSLHEKSLKHTADSHPIANFGINFWFFLLRDGLKLWVYRGVPLPLHSKRITIETYCVKPSACQRFTSDSFWWEGRGRVRRHGVFWFSGRKEPKVYFSKVFF